MGRAFEYRKATKLKRWGHMAKTFTKIGKHRREGWWSRTREQSCIACYYCKR